MLWDQASHTEEEILQTIPKNYENLIDIQDEDIEDYYKICYDSKRWEKWVDDDFVPEDNKEELIKICGHYVLSDKKFLEIKPDIDEKIKLTIKNKLRELCQEI